MYCKKCGYALFDDIKEKLPKKLSVWLLVGMGIGAARAGVRGLEAVTMSIGVYTTVYFGKSVFEMEAN